MLRWVSRILTQASLRLGVASVGFIVGRVRGALPPTGFPTAVSPVWDKEGGDTVIVGCETNTPVVCIAGRIHGYRLGMNLAD